MVKYSCPIPLFPCFLSSYFLILNWLTPIVYAAINNSLSNTFKPDFHKLVRPSTKIPCLALILVTLSINRWQHNAIFTYSPVSSVLSGCCVLGTVTLPCLPFNRVTHMHTRLASLTCDWKCPFCPTARLTQSMKNWYRFIITRACHRN